MSLTSIEGLRAEDVLRDALAHRAPGYILGERLARLYPNLAIVETQASGFDVEEFAADGKCTMQPRPDFYQQFTTYYYVGGKFSETPTNAWMQVTWEGASLQVVLASWESQSYGTSERYGVIGDSVERCRAFITAVCEWTHEVRGEILVYAQGCFSKNTKLYEAVQRADFDQLILEGVLKQQLREDFTQFLESRATYEEHGVPWKRGALFIGPPGNGKTLCVKALIKALRIPCIYVQAFSAEYVTMQQAIEQVFHRARTTAPCVLVLEDIDSLLTNDSRSFFLNELDGFAANTGVITLATTNHPEKLDASIIHRPSRFDRKYHFNLPEAATRAAYIAMWNARMRSALQLSEAGRTQVVELTDGFSFAYIQEVFVSSMMRWMATRDSIGILPIALAQIEELRKQMATASSTQSVST